MNGRIVKEQIYEHFARIGKALDSPQRLELLDLLCQGERTVEYLAHEAHLNFANASRHLQILRGARLVDTRKEGVHVFYSLSSDEVCLLFRNLRELAKKHLAEVNKIMEDYFGKPDQMEPINRKELLARASKHISIILDVRPREEYDSVHLLFAKSIPLKELKSRMNELPKDREIIAYCRGSYCVLAHEAVQILKSKGYNAKRLEDGVREWQSAGFPVASKK